MRIAFFQAVMLVGAMHAQAKVLTDNDDQDYDLAQFEEESYFEPSLTQLNAGLLLLEDDDNMGALAELNGEFSDQDQNELAEAEKKHKKKSSKKSKKSKGGKKKKSKKSKKSKKKKGKKDKEDKRTESDKEKAKIEKDEKKKEKKDKKE